MASLAGQVCLLVYGACYRLACRYDLHAEIEKDNVAAGVALGMNLVAMGVIVMKGVAGDFVSWEASLTRLAVTAVLGGALLLILRVLIDALLLPGARIAKEIAEDRNLNAAWVEGSVLTGLAGLLVAIL